MRILFISEYYPPYIKGGAEVSTFLLVNQLAIEHTITIACSKIATGPWNERGVEVHPIIRRFTLKNKNILSILQYGFGIIFNPLISAVAIIRLAKKVRPELVNIVPSSYQFIPIALIMRLILGIPTIVDCRDYSIICPAHMNCDRFDDSIFRTHGYRCLRTYNVENKFLSLFIAPFALYESTVFNAYKYSLRFTLEHVDGLRLITLSRYVRDQLVLNGFAKNKISVIANICEIPDREPQQGKLGLPTFAFAGRLEKGKGVWEIVMAAEMLQKRGYDFEVHIAGTGDEASSLESYVRDNPNTPVKLLGKMDHTQVMELYEAATAILGPSQWPEPFGRFILEAFSMGKPIIATRSGGIPEAINDTVTGVLIDPKSPSQLSYAMQYFIDHPEKGIAMKAAIIREREKYKATWIAKERVGIYANLIARQHTSL
ncbi:MAG: glycosyl transferase [Candidatus Parcubacteria bacterium]|nr:glycosyl transferase [Candidatus Parcubacteria bacterium]